MGGLRRRAGRRAGRGARPAVDAAALVEQVKAHPARYKGPRVVLVRDSIGRAPNGKVDHKGLTTWAREQAAAAAGG